MGKSKKGKVMVGMSGGVDSSVSAALLKQQGYDVVGVTMQIWQEDKEENGTCCSIDAVEDARRVANKLEIPFYVLNFKKIFEEKVIKYFISEYLQGRTPNPCIACNKYIKFDELLNKAISMNMDYIATGHYAKIEEVNGRFLLKKSFSKTKDQTYVLYSLTQEQLKRTLFPLEGLNKDEVRKIASELGLIVANKPDSQDICFVQDNDYSKFISENTDSDVLPGNIVDKDGNVLGKHNGIYNYTIGQRKGLGISSNNALYVLDIDLERNEVVIGDESEIYGKELTATNINLISTDKLEKEMKVNVKIRYGSKEAPATIFPLENGDIHVVFDSPQRAITSGQSAVFYNGDIVVGGGEII